MAKRGGKAKKAKNNKTKKTSKEEIKSRDHSYVTY